MTHQPVVLVLFLCLGAFAMSGNPEFSTFTFKNSTSRPAKFLMSRRAIWGNLGIFWVVFGTKVLTNIICLRNEHLLHSCWTLSRLCGDGFEDSESGKCGSDGSSGCA